MKKIIMLGAGGFAREVLDTIDFINAQTDDAIEPIGFVYDGGDKDVGNLIHGIPVLGDLACLKDVDFSVVQLVATVGRPVWRRKMVAAARSMGGRFMSLIHPTAMISKWSKVGEGAIIQRYCGINTEVVVGDFFVGNSYVVVGHDTVIGDCVQMNSHVFISGGSVIGNDVFIGVRATVLPARIGDGAVIGACALITKDVPPEMLAKGMPARFFEIEKKAY